MTEKKCTFCGSTRNVVYEDPAQGPVCQVCWFVAGDEDEKEEKPATGRPGEAPEEPDRGSGR